MSSQQAVTSVQDSRRRNRLRFLVRQSGRGREALEGLCTSFGLRDQAELSDRATAQLAAQHHLSEEQLYDRLLWDQLVHLALSRIDPQRREQVKVALDIDSDEALGLRVVQDLMRDRKLSPEQVHDHLLEITLRSRVAESVRAVLAATGITADEADALIREAGYRDAEVLSDAVVASLQRIKEADPAALASALEVSEAPAAAELACLIVGLEIRSRCEDAGARRAAEMLQRLRRCLAGETTP